VLAGQRQYCILSLSLHAALWRAMPSKGESLSPWEHTAIGALAGFVEVCVMQPTVGVKNALQEGRSVPRNPMVLYRGLTVSHL
jgi:hypothetical protein